MANTYSQLTIQAVFVVKHRDNIITTHWRNELHKYISGTITNEGVKSIAVGGWKDHVHILFGLPVTTSVSDFMRIIKANSSKWINEKGFVKGKFQWQEGYAAFSYSKDQRTTLIHYIMNQEEHHRKKTFKEEYIEMLTEFEIVYNTQYLFEFFD
jgi:putative transposase